MLIKEVDNNDIPGCIDLLSKTFKGKSDEKTFKWRFGNWGKPKPILVCARHENRIVSFNSWIPWQFEYNKNKYLGCQSGESATAVDFRGRGLFGEILQYGHELASKMEVDFLFGFPSEMSYGSFYRAGYFPVGPNYFSIRLLNPIGRKKKYQPKFALEEDLGPMLVQSNKITPIFDNDYYEWRYKINTKQYDIIQYYENRCNAIFFMRRKKKFGLTELLLLDFQTNILNEMFIENAIRYLDSIYSGKAMFIRTFFNEYSDRGRILSKFFKTRVKSRYHIFILKPISKRIDTNVLLNSYCWDNMPHIVDEL